MTNKEAINHIRYSLIDERYPLPKELGIEVLNMAIEALKNEPITLEKANEDTPCQNCQEFDCYGCDHFCKEAEK